MYKNGKLIISEIEMLKIKKMYNLVKEDDVTNEPKDKKRPLNEFGGGVVKFGKGMFKGLKSLFTKSDDKVLQFVSNEIGKSVSFLAKSNKKQISLTAIRSSTNYKKSLSALVEDLSTKKFGKTYKELTVVQKEGLIKEATKNLDGIIKKELQTLGKQIVSNIDNLKGVKLTKMGQKTSQIVRTINNLDKVKYTKATTLLKSNAKLIGDGKKGVKILENIKSGKVNIVKGGQLLSANTKTLGQSNIKVFRVTRGQLKTLAMLGLTGAAVLYLIGMLNPNDAIAVVDENNNDISDEQGGDPSSGGSQQTYRPCTEFPFTFGCKSQAIKEVQKCLGMEERHQTGNFGPITLNYLETKRGENTITKQVYDDIMKICKQTSTDVETPSTGTETPADVETPSTGTETPSTGTETPSTGESGGEIYARLNADGVLGFRMGTKKRVLVYKGPDLSEEEIEKLTIFLQSRGYRFSRFNNDYRKGDKIVFKRNKTPQQ
jgi:hypothetical protein